MLKLTLLVLTSTVIVNNVAGDVKFVNLVNSSKFECFECNSKTNEYCKESIEQNSDQLCKSKTNQCYILSDKENVIRGCVGDNIVSAPENCTDRTLCSICKETQCNGEPIKAETCFEVSNGTIESETKVECPLTLEPMGCFHVESDDFINKGCVSDVTLEQQKWCEQSAECKICFGDNCNSLKKLRKCVICDSINDFSCISLNETRDSEPCESYFNRCFTYTNGTTVQRGCLEDMTTSFITKCDENRKDRCHRCEEPGCNNETVTDKCVECVSKSNETICHFNPELFEQKFCSVTSKSSGCYLNDSGKTVRRGCVGDLSKEERKKCHNKSKTCQTCFQPGCNRKYMFKQSCISCNGTEQTDCASNLGTKSIECPNYTSSCLNGIDAKGYTHMRCSTTDELDEKSFPNGYELCFVDMCNQKTFPENRLKCYHCNQDEACDFNFTINEAPRACNVYDENDKCFTVYDEDVKYSRGCMSDQSEAKTFCEKNPDSCKICNETACNVYQKSSGSISAAILPMLIFIAPILIIDSIIKK